MRNKSLIIAIAMLGAGCATKDSDTYRANETGQTLSTKPAIVLSVREVTIEGAEGAGNNWYGAGAGAAGGAIGAKVAGGSDLIAVGAAIVGAGAGYLAEEFFDRRTGYEYILQDANNPDRTFVVVMSAGENPPADPGSRVSVISGSGYTRVVPVWTPTSPDSAAGSSGGVSGATSIEDDDVEWAPVEDNPDAN